MKTLIVVDGPAASGKGTLAARLAVHHEFEHLDSGLYYRGVASRMLKESCPAVVAALYLSPQDLEAEDVRSEVVTAMVPYLSSDPCVRQHVNEKLREWRLRRSRGVVMDGRAGAFEFPEAQVKLFLTASVMERAQRRFMELNDKWKDKGEGEAPIFEKVLTAIQLRDQLDIERPVYPLKQHNDALLIDSTELNTDQVFTEALFLCESRMRMRASA